jgi:hypothetical protein
VKYNGVSSVTYEERADHIAELLESQLGVRGKSLDAKLRKAGRLLPRDIRRHGEKIVEAVSLQGSPKLARMVDEKSTVSAYDAIEKYLSSIDAWDRRKGNALGFLTTNAFNLLVVTALLIIVLRWRGFI